MPKEITDATGHVPTYDEARFAKIRKKFETGNGTEIAVLCGAVASPACFGEKCFWPGCQETGNWTHIAWECEKGPAPQDLGVPTDPFEKRLGWTSAEGKWEALSWLCKVAQEIWERRYENKRRLKWYRDRKEKKGKKDEEENDAGEERNTAEEEEDSSGEDEEEEGNDQE